MPLSVKVVNDMKKLIISPHLDDEVYGCFSMLRNSHIYYVGSDESDCPKDPKHRIGKSGREKEAEEVNKLVGSESHYISRGRVNNYAKDKYSIIKDIEDEINEYKPDMILIPYPSYNQDHKTVYEACMIALRPHDKNHFVKKVLVYDGYDYTKWGEQMEMNYFRSVDIGAKLQGCRLYESQIRKYRHPDYIMKWADMVGQKCNLSFAEGFKVLRWVE